MKAFSKLPVTPDRCGDDDGCSEHQSGKGSRPGISGQAHITKRILSEAPLTVGEMPDDDLRV